MCTYNGERFLNEQIDSILAQDYPICEIIICDDASTDNTFKIISEYQSQYPSLIKAIKNNQNIGYIKNFKQAMSFCGGEYFALADQDDVWMDDKISVLVDAIGSADLVHSDASLIDQNGLLINTSYTNHANKKENKTYIQLFQKNIVTGCTTLLKKDLYSKSYPFLNTIPHDHWLALNAYDNNGIKYVDMVLVKYRQHDNNVLGAVLSDRKNSLNISKRSKYERYKTKMAFYEEKADILKKKGYTYSTKLYRQYYEYYNSYFEKKIRLKSFLFHLRHFKDFSKNKVLLCGLGGLLNSIIGYDLDYLRK